MSALHPNASARGPGTQATALQGSATTGPGVSITLQRSAALLPASNAAQLHRSEALAAFKQALAGAKVDAVGQWLVNSYADAGRGAQARDAWMSALNTGLDAAARFDAQADSGATGAPKVSTMFASRQAESLVRSTQTLLAIDQAHTQFEQARSVFNDPKATTAQRWAARQGLQAAHAELRAMARQETLGAFDAPTSHNLKLIMRSLAAECSRGVELLESKVKESGSSAAQDLFKQRDGLDADIRQAEARFDHAVQAQQPEAKLAATMGLKALIAQRSALDAAVGQALGAHASGIPGQAPGRTIQQHQPPVQSQPAVQQYAVQKPAVQQSTAQPPAPTRAAALQEGVAALAAHIRRLDSLASAGRSGSLNQALAKLQTQLTRERDNPSDTNRPANQSPGGIKRFLPKRLVGFLQQQSITKGAQQGWGEVQFKPGLDTRSAVAAHVKGVLLQAGLSATALPSRRELRQQMASPQQGTAPLSASPAAPAQSAISDAEIADMERRIRALHEFPSQPKPISAPSGSGVAGNPVSSSHSRDLQRLELDMSPEAQALLRGTRQWLQEEETHNNAILKQAQQNRVEFDKRQQEWAALAPRFDDAALLQELQDLENGVSR